MNIKKNNKINKILKSGTIRKEKKIVKGLNGIEREIEEYVSSLPKKNKWKYVNILQENIQKNLQIIIKNYKNKKIKFKIV
jgi:hypothetical protein